MKKCIIFLILVFFCFGFSSPHHKIIARQNAAAACSATYTEPFTTANTDDVDGNTMFDAEYDFNSICNILDNELTLLIETNSTLVYLKEEGPDNVSEITVKYTIEFSDVAGIDDGTSILRHIKLEDNSGVDQAYIVFQASGGNLSTAYGTLIHDGGSVNTSTIDISGLAVDTKCDVVIYWKKDASAGGLSLKVGAAAAVDTGFNEDNHLKDGVGSVFIGATEHYWGDGANDTTMTVDDFEIYLCDAR